jgi:hypothetical protein
LDLLHERLSNLQFFVRQLMFPRRPRSKIGDGLKFFEPEVLAIGRLVLGVEPFRPPSRVLLRCLEVEVGHVRTHLTAKAASLELQRMPDDEDLAPERPVGLDPQETLVEHDETCEMENCVGIQVMKLNPVDIKKATEERMRGK